MTQARVAHANQRLYFTLRGPRAVLAEDGSLTQRLSPYFFSTHIRSDFYAHVALRQIAERHRATPPSKVNISPLSRRRDLDTCGGHGRRIY